MSYCMEGSRGMKIGTREIGGSAPAYIIAEMSANHAGNIENAKK